jgi:hypothetical protein
MINCLASSIVKKEKKRKKQYCEVNNYMNQRLHIAFCSVECHVTNILTNRRQTCLMDSQERGRTSSDSSFMERKA